MLYNSDIGEIEMRIIKYQLKRNKKCTPWVHFSDRSDFERRIKRLQKEFQSDGQILIYSYSHIWSYVVVIKLLEPPCYIVDEHDPNYKIY